jgi:hypothetical protein
MTRRLAGPSGAADAGRASCRSGSARRT